jgi:hypothetical protein
MKQPINSILIQIYRQLLRFFPRQFRDEFSQEMMSVFSEKLHNASGLARMVLFWRELRDLPVVVWHEHLYQRKKRKMDAYSPRDFGEEPITGWKIFMIFVPFVIAIAFILLSSLPRLSLDLPNWAVPVGMLGMLALLLTSTVVGISKGLPRWAIPTVGVLVGIAGVLLFNSWTHYLTPPNYSSILGKVLRMAISRFIFFGHMLLITILLVLLSARLRLLNPFYRSLRRDWSLLSLLLYGSVLPILFISFDAYQGTEPYHITGLLIMAAGVWLYLRLSRARWRLLTLLAAVAVTMSLFGLGIYLLYPQQPWSAYTAFPRWWEAVVPLIEGAVWMVIITIPAALKLFPANSPPLEEPSV